MDDTDIINLLIAGNVFSVSLFLLSEFLASSSCESNGLLQLVSRRIPCMGGRRVMVGVHMSDEDGHSRRGWNRVRDDSPSRPLLESV
jgi:hypothetical protein